jgi:hypothetical protein
VWVRSWGPDYALTSEIEGGAFDTSAEAAKQVSAILAAIARSEEELGHVPTRAEHRFRDMTSAHADELHAGLPGEGCPECEGRELSSYPRALDIERKKKSWPTA